MLVWPTSEFPIWPSGRPTSMPEAPIWVRGFSEKSLSRFGVLAALMALPSAGAKPKPSIIISIKGFFHWSVSPFRGDSPFARRFGQKPSSPRGQMLLVSVKRSGACGPGLGQAPKRAKMFRERLNPVNMYGGGPFIPKERPPPIPFQTYLEAAFTIAAKSGAFKAAPPMRPPSTSGWATSSSAFLAFMEPPY